MINVITYKIVTRLSFLCVIDGNQLPSPWCLLLPTSKRVVLQRRPFRFGLQRFNHVDGVFPITLFTLYCSSLFCYHNHFFRFIPCKVVSRLTSLFFSENTSCFSEVYCRFPSPVVLFIISMFLVFLSFCSEGCTAYF
jgi:hypothetical protein